MTVALACAVAAAVAAAAAFVDLAVVAAAWSERRARTGSAEPSSQGPAGGPAARGPAGVSAGRRVRGVRAAAALAGLGRRLGVPAVAPATLAARIEAAGAPLGLGVADLLAVKAGAAAVALVAGAPLAAVLPGRLPLPAAVAAPVVGFLAPDWILARRVRRRARAMELELPDLLDLLRVAVGAGLAVPRALEEVGRRHGGLLAGEWRRAAGRMALGVSQREAMRELARRCPAAGMAALVAALGRAERHGAPLGPSLAALAADARAARAQRVREHAAKAAPKMQLVIALLLVPSVLLLVGAALVAALAGAR